MFREDVDEKLVKLYSNILQFQAQAASQFDHNSFIRALRNGAKLDDWQALLDNIDASDYECLKLMGVLGLDSSDRSFSQVQQSFSRVQHRLDEVYALLERSHQRNPNNPNLYYLIEDIDTVSY
jgi:hypothetical protein